MWYTAVKMGIMACLNRMRNKIASIAGAAILQPPLLLVQVSDRAAEGSRKKAFVSNTERSELLTTTFR